MRFYQPFRSQIVLCKYLFATRGRVIFSLLLMKSNIWNRHGRSTMYTYEAEGVFYLILLHPRATKIFFGLGWLIPPGASVVHHARRDPEFCMRNCGILTQYIYFALLLYIVHMDANVFRLLEISTTTHITIHTDYDRCVSLEFLEILWRSVGWLHVFCTAAGFRFRDEKHSTFAPPVR